MKTPFKAPFVKALFVVLALAVLAPANALAQSSTFMKIYEKYKDDPDGTTLTVSGSILNWLGSIDTDEAEEVNDALKAVKGMEAMRLVQSPNITSTEFKNTLRAFRNNNYESLLSVRSEESTVELMIHEKSKGIIDEIVMLISDSEDREYTLMSFAGTIALKDIQKIMKDSDISVD